MIKAIFFDIDGTLVSFKTHEVPSSTRKALAALRQKGIKIFIATGRHQIAINNLPGLKFDGYVTLNGGLCYAEHNTIIYKHPIPTQDVERMVSYMENHPMPCVFVREKDMYINYVDETVKNVFHMLNFIQVPQTDLRTLMHEEVMQFIAFFNEEKEPEVMSHLPHCRSTRWFHSFSDVVPQATSKTIGIQKIIKQFGIHPDEVMAFGDGGNDMEMLRDTTLGVAMGNAEEEVKKTADYITTSVDDDGIALALKHFGLIP